MKCISRPCTLVLYCGNWLRKFSLFLNWYSSAQYLSQPSIWALLKPYSKATPSSGGANGRDLLRRSFKSVSVWNIVRKTSKVNTRWVLTSVQSKIYRPSIILKTFILTLNIGRLESEPPNTYAAFRFKWAGKQPPCVTNVSSTRYYLASLLIIPKNSPSSWCT